MTDETHGMIEERVLSRARGCLLGLLCGDAPGSHIEFRGPEFIREEFPDGLRTMLRGGTRNRTAGQPKLRGHRHSA